MTTQLTHRILVATLMLTGTATGMAQGSMVLPRGIDSTLQAAVAFHHTGGFSGTQPIEDALCRSFCKTHHFRTQNAPF